MSKGFAEDLSRLIEAVVTFPKDSPRTHPVPLRRELKETSIFSLENPLDGLADHKLVGDKELHYRTLQRLLMDRLAEKFHIPADGKSRIDDGDGIVYVQRFEAQNAFRLALDQSQLIYVFGVTGSGKTTLVGRVMHDCQKEHNFIYLNCASNDIALLHNTMLQHSDYSDKPPTPEDLAIFRDNIATYFYGLVKGLGQEERKKGDRKDALDLINAIRELDPDDQPILVFDDLDVFPAMVQAACIQLAIDLRRGIDKPVVVAQRQSNSQRLIHEGAFADIYTEIDLSPATGEKSSKSHDLTISELILIYQNRLQVLIKSRAANEYFRKWHAVPFREYFSNDLKNFMEVNWSNVRFLIEDCDLFDCCNRSIRACNLVLGNLITQILTDHATNISAEDFFRRNPPLQLRTKLRDLLLHELFEPSTGSAPMPSLFDHFEDQKINLLSLRAIEVCIERQGITFKDWHQILCSLYEEIDPTYVRQALQSLTSKRILGDPLCVRTTRNMDTANVFVMPGGKHYARTLAVSVDYICRSYKSDGSFRIDMAEPVERVRHVLECIRYLESEWFATDLARLSKLRHGVGRSLIRDHYLSRALKSIAAYNAKSPTLAEHERSVIASELEAIRLRVEGHLTSIRRVAVPTT